LPINPNHRSITGNANTSGKNFGQSYEEEHDIYSPIAHKLRFSETKDSRGETKMKVEVISMRK
jgi:hypothetical protein